MQERRYLLRTTYGIAATAVVATTLALVGVFQLIPGPNTSASDTPGPHNLLPHTEASYVPEETEQRIVQAYGKLPLHFEPNQGQIAEEAKFMARGNGYTLFLTANEMVLSLIKPAVVRIYQ